MRLDDRVVPPSEIAGTWPGLIERVFGPARAVLGSMSMEDIPARLPDVRRLRRSRGHNVVVDLVAAPA